MKTAIVLALILSAATAAAETSIIEYPDHYYAESTGSPVANPASSADRIATSASAPPSVDPQTTASPRQAVPATNFDIAAKSMDPAEVGTQISNEIQRLQKQRSELLAPQAGASSEQAALRQERAAGALRKLNRLSSELLKIPQP
ncbi:hypothetical protein [Geomonas sp.]|uniref:hypothetical protein n=1 Tax=Geomonas sp. TaxID=2651584 RepID=UPI002B47F0F9|nr:hypothetical protein [Geomonas sp.]HJV36502.1 hypothetical protein [Geomonas sp.]